MKTLQEVKSFLNANIKNLSTPDGKMNDLKRSSIKAKDDLLLELESCKTDKEIDTLIKKLYGEFLDGIIDNDENGFKGDDISRIYRDTRYELIAYIGDWFN